MTKLQTVLASLVAVIPAGLLAVLMVLGLLNHFESISKVMPLMIAIFLGLICCVAVMLSPVFVLVGGGAGKPSGKGGAAAGAVVGGDELLAEGDFEDEGLGADDGDLLESGEFGADDVADFDDEAFAEDDEWEDGDDEEWENT